MRMMVQFKRLFLEVSAAWIPVLPERCLRAAWVFDLHCFCGNSDHDVMRLDVARDHGAGADQRVVSDLHAGENGRVIGDANAVSDARSRRLDLVDVVDVVVVGIDVCVVGNRDVVADVDAAAIVEQHVTVDDHVVAEREVVTKRPLDEVPAFEVVADAAKNQSARAFGGNDVRAVSFVRAANDRTSATARSSACVRRKVS